MHIFLQKGLGISLILWLVFMVCVILMVLEFCPGNCICWDCVPFICSMKLLISVNLFFGSFLPANRLLRPASYKDSRMIPIPWLSYFLPIICCQSLLMPCLSLQCLLTPMVLCRGAYLPGHWSVFPLGWMLFEGEYMGSSQCNAEHILAR